MIGGGTAAATSSSTRGSGCVDDACLFVLLTRPPVYIRTHNKSVGVHFPPVVFSDLDNDFDVKWLIFLTNWSVPWRMHAGCRRCLAIDLACVRLGTPTSISPLPAAPATATLSQEHDPLGRIPVDGLRRQHAHRPLQPPPADCVGPQELHGCVPPSLRLLTHTHTPQRASERGLTYLPINITHTPFINPPLHPSSPVQQTPTAVAALTVSLIYWTVLFPAIGRTSLVRSYVPSAALGSVSEQLGVYME